MSDIVQPFIFPQGELEERWKLRRLIERIVVLDSLNPVFEKLDAKVIRDIFEIENGGTNLTAAAISNMLYAGGYTKEETGGYAQLNGGVNFSNFQLLKRESKLLLVHCMQDNNPRAAACRKIMLAERNGQTIDINEKTGDISVGGNIDWIRLWLEFFTISRFNSEQLMHSKVKWKPDKRASIVMLHNFYCNVMRYYGKSPVTRKMFRQYLEQLGVKFKKGYANHTSGVLYAEGLWIPTTNENQQKSIEVGYAVIDCSKDEVYTPYGTKLRNGLMDQKIAVYRRLGYDESQKQTLETIPVEIPEKKVISGGETEVRKDVTSQATSGVTTPTENLVGHDVNSEQKTKKAAIQITEDTDKQRTSGGTIAAKPTVNDTDASEEWEDDAEETSYAILKAKDPSRKPKAFVDYDPLDTAAAASFLNGGGDTDNEDEYADSRDWEDDGEDTVTVETVLTALRVANNIQPITIASLDYWLNRMQTSLAELQVTAEELIAMI